jgi:hypothetical protein
MREIKVDRSRPLDRSRRIKVLIYMYDVTFELDNILLRRHDDIVVLLLIYGVGISQE